MEDDLKKLEIGEGLKGQRLDVALTTAGVCISRSQAQKLIADGKVIVNGKSEKASYKVQITDLIQVDQPTPKKLELIPYDFPIDVVYEDEHLIVVDKPGGLVVHPAYGHQSDTLINALLARNTKLSQGGEEFRPGLVHRIDKGTSGLLVLAKTDQAHNSLARQFKNKTIHRRYWALCFRNKPLEAGTIETNLTRDNNNRQRFMVCKSDLGKHAITHYQLLHEAGPFGLYQLQLETGRTHQIRVHMSFQQNSIVGDEVYGGKNQAKNLKSQPLKKLILEMDRFALHARELGFVHPASGESVRFISPLPEDLKQLFDMGGFSEFIDKE